MPTSSRDSTEARLLKAQWAERIRGLRGKLKLSRATFAKTIGVNETSVGRYESGEIAPKAEVLYEMIELAKNIGWVWGFTGGTLQVIYESMLRDSELVPDSDNGALVFLEIRVKATEHFIEVLTKISEYATLFHRFGSPGAGEENESEEDGVNAYALFVLPPDQSLEMLEKELFALPYVQRVQTKANPPLRRPALSKLV